MSQVEIVKAWRKGRFGKEKILEKGESPAEERSKMDKVYSFSSFVCGVALLVVGFAHLFKHVLGHRWCEKDCVGPVSVVFLTVDRFD